MQDLDQTRTKFQEMKNGLKIKRISYLEREHLNELKQNLCLKVFRDLSNKYHLVIKDKNYDIINFTNDFDREMEKSYDFNNPEYKIFFRKIESIFLNKMFHLKDKNTYNDSQLNENEMINDTKKKSYYSNNNITGNISFNNISSKIENAGKENKTQNFNYGKGYSLRNLEKYHEEFENKEFENNMKKKLYSPKTLALRRRETDEWAKVMEKDYNKFIEETEKERKKSYKLKSEYSKALKEQIKEKHNLKRIVQDKEKDKFEKEFIENSEKQKTAELKKLQEFRRKCLDEKQSLIRDFRDSQEKKKKTGAHEKAVDKKFLDNQLNSEKEMELLSFEKKQNIRKELYKIKKENDIILAKIKSDEKIKKESDKKHIKEYSKMLEEYELRRLNDKEIRLKKILNYTSDEFYSKFIDINNLIKKEFEEKSILKYEEEQKKKIEEEYKNIEKRKSLLNETKQYLITQIEHKKRISQNDIELKNKEKKEIENDLEKYDHQKKNELITSDIIKKKYKKDLENQNNNKKEQEFMTEQERKINKCLL